MFIKVCGLHSLTKRSKCIMREDNKCLTKNKTLKYFSNIKAMLTCHCLTNVMNKYPVYYRVSDYTQNGVHGKKSMMSFWPVNANFKLQQILYKNVVMGWRSLTNKESLPSQQSLRFSLHMTQGTVSTSKIVYVWEIVYVCCAASVLLPLLNITFLTKLVV